MIIMIMITIRIITIDHLGMSGIKAARDVADGCSTSSVTIFEAGSRIGGRMFTDRSLGFACDMGASWVLI